MTTYEEYWEGVLRPAGSWPGYRVSAEEAETYLAAAELAALDGGYGPAGPEWPPEAPPEWAGHRQRALTELVWMGWADPSPEQCKCMRLMPGALVQLDDRVVEHLRAQVGEAIFFDLEPDGSVRIVGEATMNEWLAGDQPEETK